MLRSILSFFISVLCTVTITAQIPISLNPWDHSLTYNHASVGVFEDEYIQMSVLSGGGDQLGQNTPVFTLPGTVPITTTMINPLNLRNFVDQNASSPTQFETRNIYFLGYQKTIFIGERNRLTGALQLQRFEHNVPNIQDPTQIGFTTNFHKNLITRGERHRYWSFGLQFNLLLREPNLAVAAHIYQNILIPEPTLSLEAYVNQFRDTGFQQAGSINYTNLRSKRSLFNIGLTVRSFQYKILARRFDPLTGSHAFESDTNREIIGNIDYQHAFRNKFLVQLRMVYARNTIIAAGIGFRIGKHNLIKMMFASGGVTDTRYAYLSYDTKRYKYGLSFRKANSRTSLNYLQCTVQYRMNDRDTSSLISKDY